MTEEENGIFYEVAPCRNYMYKLWEKWSNERPCIFVMLNPATTVGLAENKTVKNCIAIAKKEKCGSVTLVDLFSHVSAGWQELLKAKSQGKNIVGPKNKHEKHLRKALKVKNALIIMAWGERKGNDEVIEILNGQIESIKKIIRKYASNAEVVQLESKNREGVMTHPCNFSRLEKIEFGKKENLYKLGTYEFAYEQDDFLCKLLSNLYAPLKRIACKQGNSL